MKKITNVLLVICLCVICLSEVTAQTIRKPWREMTTGEKEAYINAINTLPTSIVQALSNEHQRLAYLFVSNNHIHNSNIFLPWHRVFLLYFEEKLREINPEISLPYWDWRDDWSSGADLFEDSSGGSSGLFGYNVSGSVWIDPPTNAKYFRSFNPGFTQPTTSEINSILSNSLANFTQFRNSLEVQPHNRGHVFVGGTMSTMFSPSDPVFYLHHSMVDKLWDDWIKSKWTGGTLPFSNDADPQLNMLTFIGYAGSTNESNVVRVNPNDWIDSKTKKTWYAEGGIVQLTSYTVSGIENYRYTGIIDIGTGFTVPQNTTCNVLSGSKVVLNPGFHVAAGGTFTATSDAIPFGRVAIENGTSITTRLDKKYGHLLEASLNASSSLIIPGNVEVYGIKTTEVMEKSTSIYPNPGKGKFTVRVNFSGNCSIQTFNSKGVQVYPDIIKISESEYALDFVEQSVGLYFIKIITEGGKIYEQKAIIQY